MEVEIAIDEGFNLITDRNELWLKLNSEDQSYTCGICYAEDGKNIVDLSGKGEWLAKFEWTAFRSRLDRFFGVEEQEGRDDNEPSP